MDHWFFILLVAACALLNRARGSQLFGLTTSTVVGRLVSMGGIALLTSLLAIPHTLLMFELFGLTFAGLMLWATPAWDAYWSAELGDDPAHSKLWGVLRMGWRQLLIVPTLMGQAVLLGHPERAGWAMLALLYGLPYLAYGVAAKPVAVQWSEYTVGALIGLTIGLLAGGV